MTYKKDANFLRVKKMVYTLAVLSIITFLSGFLKYTPFEHSTIILIFLLFIGGLSLIRITPKIEVSIYLKLFLMIIGISTIVFMVLVAVAGVNSIVLKITLSETLESLEGYFYLNSLFFLIGEIGSIIMFMIKRNPNHAKGKFEEQVEEK